MVSLNFTITKQKSQIQPDYQYIILKIRYETKLGEEKFHMNNRIFKELYKNLEFKKSIKEDIIYIINTKYENIRYAFEYIQDKGVSKVSDFKLSFLPVGYGININIYIPINYTLENIINKTISNLN